MKKKLKKRNDWINEMEDPRHESYVTYTQSGPIYMGILKNAYSGGCAADFILQHWR